MHCSFTQPNGASFPLGSEAVNFEVLGHIGATPGKVSVHGVDVNIDHRRSLGLGVLCGETDEQNETSKAQHQSRQMGPENISNLLLAAKRVTSNRQRYITTLPSEPTLVLSPERGHRKLTCPASDAAATPSEGCYPVAPISLPQGRTDTGLIINTCSSRSRPNPFEHNHEF